MLEHQEIEFIQQLFIDELYAENAPCGDTTFAAHYHVCDKNNCVSGKRAENEAILGHAVTALPSAEKGVQSSKLRLHA